MKQAGASSKSRRRFVRGALVAAIATAALVLALARWTRVLDWLELGTYDARARYAARRAAPDPRIVIIDVDEATFNDYKEDFGRWPWPRTVWTAVVRYVARGNPKVIGLDMMYGGGSDKPETDAAFAQAIHDAGNVVLAYVFTDSERQMTPELLREESEKWASLAPEAAPVVAGQPGEPVAIATQALNLPLDELRAAAAGLGCTRGTPDADGSFRRTPLEFTDGRNVYRSFALRIADLAAGNANRTGRLRAGEFEVAPGRAVPVDDAGRLLIAWKGRTADPALPMTFAYPRLPLWKVLCSMQPDTCADNKVYYAPEFFKDKIVLLAVSFAGSADLHPTPLFEATPGVVAHANAIDGLLNGEGVRLAPRWLLPLVVIAFAAFGSFLLVRRHSAAWATVAVLALIALYAGLSFVLLARAHLWLPLVAPVAAVALSYVSTGAIRYSTTGRDLRRTRGVLERYVAPELVGYVMDHLGNLDFAGEKRELTIFFSDVRNFTTLTEKSDPQELITLLNEYLAAMTEIIFKYEGIVDKFIGDGILAHWGAFSPGKNHAELACRASLEMIARMEELNRKWSAEGRPSIAIGIGINTGEVIFGNVGSGKKIEFTVIGDPVNLASRLEGLNKEFKTSIIISEFTLRHLQDVAIARPLGGVKVKGKTIETSVFELQGLREGENRGRSTPAANG